MIFYLFKCNYNYSLILKYLQKPWKELFKIHVYQNLIPFLIPQILVCEIDDLKVTLNMHHCEKGCNSEHRASSVPGLCNWENSYLKFGDHLRLVIT